MKDTETHREPRDGRTDRVDKMQNTKRPSEPQRNAKKQKKRQSDRAVWEKVRGTRRKGHEGETKKKKSMADVQKKDNEGETAGERASASPTVHYSGGQKHRCSFTVVIDGWRVIESPNRPGEAGKGKLIVKNDHTLPEPLLSGSQRKKHETPPDCSGAAARLNLWL